MRQTAWKQTDAISPSSAALVPCAVLCCAGVMLAARSAAAAGTTPPQSTPSAAAHLAQLQPWSTAAGWHPQHPSSRRTPWHHRHPAPRRQEVGEVLHTTCLASSEAFRRLGLQVFVWWWTMTACAGCSGVQCMSLSVLIVLRGMVGLCPHDRQLKELAGLAGRRLAVGAAPAADAE
jgi:hypothetical protein